MHVAIEALPQVVGDQTGYLRSRRLGCQTRKIRCPLQNLKKKT